MRLLVTLIQHDHVLIKTEKWATDAHGAGEGGGGLGEEGRDGGDTSVRQGTRVPGTIGSWERPRADSPRRPQEGPPWPTPSPRTSSFQNGE